MTKLMLAAMIAASTAAMAQEPAAPTADAKPAVAEWTAKKPGRPGMRRSQMSAEQREKMRAMHEKHMAERKAKIDSLMLDVVKKYVLDEEKAKALVKELSETMMSARRNMMPHRARKPQK